MSAIWVDYVRSRGGGSRARIFDPPLNGRACNGFTLIEVLIAAVVASVLMASLVVSVYVAFKARDSALAGRDTSRETRYAMQIIGRDLRSALPPNGILAGSMTSTTVSNDAAQAGIVGSPPGMNSPATGTTGATADGSSFDAVTYYTTTDPTHPMQSSGDVEQVTLRVLPWSQVNVSSNQTLASETPDTPAGARSIGISPPTPAPAPTATSITSVSPVPGLSAADDPNDNVLVRSVVRNLLAPVDQTPVDQILCRHVKVFTLAYYDGTQWVSTWNSTQQGNALPQAVQVTLELGPDAGKGRDQLLTQVLMPVCATPKSGGGE